MSPVICPSHMSFWSDGHVMLGYKIIKLYIDFHKLYKHQTWYNAYVGDGTIIRSRIICKKISCYMRTLTCRQCLAESGKLFWGYVKHV